VIALRIAGLSRGFQPFAFPRCASCSFIRRQIMLGHAGAGSPPDPVWPPVLGGRRARSWRIFFIDSRTHCRRNLPHPVHGNPMTVGIACPIIAAIIVVLRITDRVDVHWIILKTRWERAERTNRRTKLSGVLVCWICNGDRGTCVQRLSCPTNNLDYTRLAYVKGFFSLIPRPIYCAA